MEQLALKPLKSNKSLHHEVELAGCTALVVEGDNTSRSVLAAQLREFGFGEIVQCSKIQSAREQFEQRRFDFVLCAQDFGPESATGQDLLDDLQRDGLLPLSTVFIMVTAEASYDKVEQAAESALDGYLLKPHSAGGLVRRLLAGRRRKLGLADIFSALDKQQVDVAIQLCQQRYMERSPFWLYCARVGAELMLRVGRFGDAANFYASIARHTTEPWARAGIARSMLSDGQFGKATALLYEITSELPDFADAYDVLGRAQLKQGQLPQALESFRRASNLTPGSVARLQRLGLLTYYVGDYVEAEQLLDQTTRLGFQSRVYDYQSLALLTLMRARQFDSLGLLRCREVARLLSRKAPPSNRLRRILELTEASVSIRHGHFQDAHAVAQSMGGESTAPDFDFDMASVLLGLLALLAQQEVGLHNAELLVHRLAMRYCTSEATSSMLCAATRQYDPFAQRVRQSSEELLAMSESAMKRHLDGEHVDAVQSFLDIAEQHLNARALESAQQLLQRFVADGPQQLLLAERIGMLKDRIGASRARPGFADPSGRPSAGMALRIGAPVTETAVQW